MLVDKPKVFSGFRMYQNMKICIRQIYGDSPAVGHYWLSYWLDCLHLKMLCLYTDLVRNNLLLGVTFPHSVPFPLLVSWEVLRSLLAKTGKIESDLSEQPIGEELTWMDLEPVSNDREDQFVVCQFFPLFHKIGQPSSDWNVWMW